MDELQKYLADEAELNSALTSCIPFGTRGEIERQAVRELAAQGKTVPGWNVDQNPVTGAMAVSHDPFDQREGLYGGELAALIQAGLMTNFLGQIASVKPAVQSEVCARLDYCKRIRPVSDTEKDWDSVTNMAGWLIEKAFAVPFPPLAFGVFLVKRGVLDRWCGCEKMP